MGNGSNHSHFHPNQPNRFKHHTLNNNILAAKEGMVILLTKNAFYIFHVIFIPPASVAGVYSIHEFRPSVRPSVRCDSSETTRWISTKLITYLEYVTEMCALYLFSTLRVRKGVWGTNKGCPMPFQW